MIDKFRAECLIENEIRYTAIYGMSYTSGNSQPLFSITGWAEEIDQRGFWQWSGGSCLHGLITEKFASLQLGELVPFHQFSQDGTPPHYIEEAVHWALLAAGNSPWQSMATVPAGHSSFKDVLAKHILADAVGDREEFEYEFMRLRCGIANDVPQTSEEDFKYWLLRRLPSVQTVFHAAMKKHGIGYISPEEMQPAKTYSLAERR